MKKIFLLVILLLCIVGCVNKKVSVPKNDIIVNKIDKDKDYVLSKPYKEYTLGNGDLYSSEYPEVNLDSEEISNLNLTLKNNVLLNVKGFEIVDGKVNKGSIVKYKYYISKNYISIVEESNTYFNGIYGNTKITVYNIDIKHGTIVDNSKLLRFFDEDEEDIYEEIRESRIPDADYIAMYVRNNGYNLYVNERGHLIIYINYESDDGEIIKELVLDD